MARYYADPDLAQLAAERQDPVIDFHWTFVPPVPGADPAWFSARWQGVLTAPVSGTVRVGLSGTDGYRLWLDDSLVIDAWDQPAASERVVPVRFAAGKGGGIRIETRQPAGNGRLRLLWDVGVVDDGERRIAEAVAAARASDMAVVMVGLEEGEFRDRASLALPGRQEELIRRVAATGRPVVVVIIGGGAVTVRSWIEEVGAVLDPLVPREAGGEALAALLFGEAAPGGRLPITFPVSEGQLPLVYNHHPTGRGDDYDDLTGLPQFPFGFGLRYTTFGYDSLRVTPDTVVAGGGLQVRCTITNTGSRAGDEVVQLYLRDPVASHTRPVLQLAGFARVSLAPGESREIRFRVDASQLALLDARLHPEVEPGRLDLLVGASARDLRLRAVVRVVAPLPAAGRDE